MHRLSRLILLALIVLQPAFVTPAPACPVCDTGTGQEVREGLFDENFARNIVGIVLPFPILLGVVAMIHFGWPGRRAERPPAHGTATQQTSRHDP